MTFDSDVSDDVDLIFDTNELAKVVVYTPPTGAAVPSVLIIPLDASLDIIVNENSDDNMDEINIMTRKSQLTVKVGGKFTYLGSEFYIGRISAQDIWTQTSSTIYKTKEKTRNGR